MRSWTRSFVLCLLASAAGLAQACSGGTGEATITCADEDRVCGSDGKIYCRRIPGTARAIQIPLECCPAQVSVSPVGTDGAVVGDPDGAVLGDSDGGASGSQDSGAAAGPDASSTGMRRDAGEVCDGGRLPFDGGIPDGGFPERDQFGVAFRFQCGRDICHPQPVPDGGFPPGGFRDF